MSAPTLPVSRVINVTINLTPTGAQSQSLSTMLLLGSSNVINPTERYRLYEDIQEVAADFGTTAPEYLAAVLWFEQSPQPATLTIGRWVQAPSAGQLIGATLSPTQQLLANFTAISNGAFKYAYDGGSVTQTSSINLSTATSLSSVAALISALTPGIVVVWDANYQRFEATSDTTGASSAVSFFTSPAAGPTDLSTLLGMSASNSGSYVSNGMIAESALNCVTFFDLNYGQTFYGVYLIGGADSDTEAIAPYIEASGNKHVFFVTTQEAGVLVAATTSDIASILSALNYNRTWLQYSSTNPYAAISAAARILPTDYTGNNTVITLFYKQEPGIVAEFLNSNQVNALENKNCNVFVNYNNNTAIIEPGQCASGVFLDIICGCDWFSLQAQASLYNLLYTSPTKIPQTDAGTQQFLNVIEAVCIQGVQNGFIAPGQWNSGGFGVLSQGDFLVKGYYVWAPKVATQSEADRAARKSVPIQAAIKLAGAVHTLALTVNVNQ
jgi:hypothetical protein